MLNLTSSQVKPLSLSESSRGLRNNLHVIAEYGSTRYYPKNTLLINENDRSDCLYLVLTGKVKTFVSDSKGKEFVLGIHESGDYFGEAELFDAGHRVASAMTMEQSRICTLTKADLEVCLNKHPALALELLFALATRVRALTDCVKNLALFNIYGRVARILEAMAIENHGKMVIERHLTQQEIANRVGASREMVSRIMKDLRVGGYICIENKKITIPRKLPANW